jgi:hypothetical protein
MNEFKELTLLGFRESADLIGCTVTKEGRTGVSVLGIATPMAKAQDMNEHGYLEQADTLLDLEREDLATLGITDMHAALVERYELTVDGKDFKMIAADDDAADPIVKLHLIVSR